MKALLVALVATQAAGCVAGAGYGFSTGLRGGSFSSALPPPPPGALSSAPEPGGRGAGPAGPAYGPGEDQHWFSSDDYLVAENGERTEKVQEMRVAKLLEPATAGAKGDALFLVSSGKELWTGNYYRSRVATAADLVVNAPAFCHSISLYRSETLGPTDKQDSRNHDWYFGAITDTSDAYKGRISVGPHSCPLEAVRVPIR